MKNRLNSVYWKVREIPFISELFEKKRDAKSWDLMGTPVMSADKGGGVTFTRTTLYRIGLLNIIIIDIKH
jgi:hypothetical protein